MNKQPESIKEIKSGLKNKTEFFFLYIQSQIKWMFFILLSGLVMSVLMLLNQVPSQEIFYGMGLCVFLLVTAVILDFQHVCRKCRLLHILAQNAAVSLDGLEMPSHPAEAEYQCLLRQLWDSRVAVQNAMERKSVELKEYYTMWVHQIKTPISAMRLLLQEKSGVTDMAEEMDELFDIERYVEMALQYMRLDSETTDFVLRRTQLDIVIKEVIHKYARMFIRGKIKLDYISVDVWVYTDEKWLAFVLEQIISNAVKYTPSGTVSIFMDAESRLVIADSGIGISPEDLPRVFEKGYTGYNGHTDKSSTGIGLYLCSRIVRKLGHGIRIESEQGKGTSVILTFPKEDKLE